MRTDERPPKDVADLSRRIVNLAGQAIPRADFLRGLADLLLRFSNCDGVRFRTYGQVEYQVVATARPEPTFRFEPGNANGSASGAAAFVASARANLKLLVAREVSAQGDLPPARVTPYGSYWTNEASHALGPGVPAAVQCLALIPFVIDEANLGMLSLEWGRIDPLARDTIESYEAVAETIGFAIAERRSQAALRERVKELTCLYGIARVIENEGDDLHAALRQMAEILPPAWQYPGIAVARIILDGVEYATGPFEGVRARQTAAVVVNRVHRGSVQVGYLENPPYADAEPFLREEEHLIHAVAREIGGFISRRQAAAEHSLLEQQLRHADRLATIGHLAAAIAHDINEPLGSILGFAQLAKKASGTPESVSTDLDKIIASCIQTREIVHKLKVFARQAPLQRTWVSLTDIAEEASAMVQGRCASEGIDLVRQLEPGIRSVEADPVQLRQVILNLAVNALQAMPSRGTLTIVTRSEETAVVLEVRDTGVGMSEDVLSRIFHPFYTTKDVGKGTGLGLSVIHGIVTAHGGTIDVESAVGRGATFRVRLPLSRAQEHRRARETMP